MKLLFLLLLIPFLSFGQATESDIQTLIDNIGSPLTPARVKGAMTAINTGKQSIVSIYTATGTDTYAVTVGSGITNNDANKQITVRFANANTSSTVSLAVNGQSALPLKTNLGADPDVGGIPANSIYLIGSTGTTWRMIGPTNEGGVPLTNWGDITGDLDDQPDLYDTLNTKARKVYKIKVVSTNYTAALGDHDNKLIIVNGGAAFEIPKDADVDFPIGATLLAADSLTTATWTKDPAVRIDTLDFTHAWTKLAANHWGFYKGAGSGGSGAYWPLGGGVVNQTADLEVQSEHLFEWHGTDDASIFEAHTTFANGEAAIITGNGDAISPSTQAVTSFVGDGSVTRSTVIQGVSDSDEAYIDLDAQDDNGIAGLLKIDLTGINGHYTNGSGFDSYLSVNEFGVQGDVSANGTDEAASQITSAVTTDAGSNISLSSSYQLGANDHGYFSNFSMQTNKPTIGSLSNSSINGGVERIDGSTSIWNHEFSLDSLGFAVRTNNVSGAGSLERLRISEFGAILLEHTNTAGGTTGNRTINKMSGTVNFAAAATTLTVTNSLCTTSSIVFAVVRTNDGTATIKNVVPGAGSFVITLGAAATAETSVGWWIIN